MTSWQGKLNLQYAHQGGTTQVISNQSQAPLRVQRSFYPEQKDICHSVILHTAGGIVGGDRLDLNIDLEEGSQALITSATAGKIYGGKGIEAQQILSMHLQTGSYLEWLPQETIIFNDAIYRQKTYIELEQECLWLSWEIVRFGRSARGEKFLSGSWRSHTEVWRAGTPLWIDRQWLQGGNSMIDSPHGLYGCPVVGTLALVGKQVNLDLLKKIQLITSDCIQNSDQQMGVTSLIEGLICRYRGHSTAEVKQWFIAVWQLLRLFYLERPVCIPRVWQI
jgi:urease accessory protein